MKHTLLTTLALLGILVFVNCGGGGGGSSSSPATTQTATPTTTLAAYYTGTEVNNGVSAPVALAVSQNGSQITGTWGNAIAGITNVGTLSGSLQGNALNATLSSNISYLGINSCQTTISGTTNSSTISGTFTTANSCNAAQSGTFTIQPTTAPPIFSANATGTLIDNIAGSGTSSATITQAGVTISGTYTSSFPAEIGTSGPYVAGASGQLYAVIIGTTLYFDLLPSQVGTCPFTGSGAISGTSIAGNYTAQLCTVSDSGTFTFAPL